MKRYLKPFRWHGSMNATKQGAQARQHLLERYVPEESAWQPLAHSLARVVKKSDCLLLEGELGAGKTSFARAFIQARAGADVDVTSPTFNLVQTYESQEGTTIWHFDLYRLKSPLELRELGLEEALASGISLIEWPAIAQRELPPEALSLLIRAEGKGRVLSISGLAACWADRLAELQK